MTGFRRLNDSNLSERLITTVETREGCSVDGQGERPGYKRKPAKGGLAGHEA